jgi:hypothetical protein
MLFHLPAAPQPANKENAPEAQPAAAFADKDFYNYLCKHVWTWQPKSKPRESIWFDPSGVASNDYWSASFYVTSARTLTIRRGKEKTLLTFSPDYSTFTGVNHDGSNHVSGYMLR